MVVVVVVVVVGGGVVVVVVVVFPVSYQSPTIATRPSFKI